jgi:hypothetical protein
MHESDEEIIEKCIYLMRNNSLLEQGRNEVEKLTAGFNTILKLHKQDKNKSQRQIIIFKYEYYNFVKRKRYTNKLLHCFLIVASMYLPIAVYRTGVIYMINSN